MESPSVCPVFWSGTGRGFTSHCGAVSVTRPGPATASSLCYGKLEERAEPSSGDVLLCRYTVISCMFLIAATVFFFLLAKWRRTPPTGNHTRIWTCTLRPGEMYCRDYMNGHKQQKRLVFHQSPWLPCSFGVARRRLLRQFGWASPLKIMVHTPGMGANLAS